MSRGALIRACNKALSIRNTGTQCNESMGPTAMLIAVPPGTSWTDDDLEDFTAYLLGKINSTKADRFYPFFGPEVPIRKITNGKEADVIATMDDGTQIFIRYGVLNRSFSTTEGGICFAQALQSLNKSGYDILEIDNAYQVLQRKNEDGTWSALKTTFMYSPSPDLPDFKNPWYVNFQVSIKPEEYLGHGVILQGDSSIVELQGLIDSEVYKNGAVTNSGATAATGGYTIVKGATNDTIDVKVSGVSISGGPVTQTVSESTDTLLAVKVKNAINAATSTNGGYTASNTAGALTITAPAGLGASINTVQATATLTGTITTTTPVAFTGGVTGTAVLKVGVRTECAQTDLVAKLGTKLVNTTLMKVFNSAGAPVTVSAATVVAGAGGAASTAYLTIPYLNGTYTADIDEVPALFAADIDGFESISPATIVVS
jgi:hypothetical protein